MIRGRLRSHDRPRDEPRPDDEIVEIDATELTGVFSAPTWLRNAGLSAWLLVGLALLLAGLVAMLALTQTIVLPVITAGVIAAVASPLVSWLNGKGLPRAAGAILVMLALVAIGIGAVLVIVGGITGEASALSSHLSGAKSTIEGWLKDLGINQGTAHDATSEGSSTITAAVKGLLGGIGHGLVALSSLAFFLALTALSLFFLLKDGPLIGNWIARHLGVPDAVGETVSLRVLQSLRGYFLGVTIVAGFNGVVVAAGALILGVPHVGTIAVVTFLGAYIPYLGAWGAGAFAVLITLGTAGTSAAIGMTILQLLANGILQQIVQPFAMGAALGIHPLAVLVVTIAGGALFGGPGLILAAPLTAAAVKISRDLARARGEEEQRAAPARADEPAPAQ
jgi:putative heme transporter